MIIHATARGAVLTWLSLPEDQRNPALLTTLRESMVATVTNQEPAVQAAGPAGRARPACRAARTDSPQWGGTTPADRVAGAPRRRRLSPGPLLRIQAGLAGPGTLVRALSDPIGTP